MLGSSEGKIETFNDEGAAFSGIIITSRDYSAGFSGMHAGLNVMKMPLNDNLNTLSGNADGFFGSSVGRSRSIPTLIDKRVPQSDSIITLGEMHVGWSGNADRSTLVRYFPTAR